jgi:hypothetical protein
MKYIILILILTFNGVVTSQTSTPQQYTTWETSNTYIIGTAFTALGSIIVMTTKQELDITPQAGPSINWVTTDNELNQFYQIHGTKIGSLWGYSIGTMITKNKELMSYKLGLFIDSKGFSYNSSLIITDNNGNPILYNTNGEYRLNYLTIPLTIGVNTNVGLYVDFGGFISLPLSETNNSITNGYNSNSVGIGGLVPTYGLITNLGVKKPINETIDVKFDTRLLSGLNNIREPQIGKLYNQSIQLLLGINIKLNKK